MYLNVESEVAVVINKRNLKVATLLLIYSLVLPHSYANSVITIDGSCQQLHNSLKKELTPEEALIFTIYRATTNGQASIYNQALNTSDYKTLLLPKHIQKPDTYFLKQIINDCKQRESTAKQFSIVVTENISRQITNIYPNSNIQLDFKKLLQHSNTLSGTHSENVIIGVGKHSCQSVLKTIEEKPILRNTYQAWLSGYLTPYIMTNELKGETVLEDIFKKTLKRCKQHPKALYSKTILPVLSKVLAQTRKE